MPELSRRKARENAFIVLYEYSYGEAIDDLIALGREEAPERAVDTYGETVLRYFEAHTKEVDARIESKLKGWRVERLARVHLALLRLAVAEMYAAEDMDSIVINEAVELAKKYADEADYQFINGVLGKIAQEKAAATAGETQ